MVKALRAGQVREDPRPCREQAGGPEHLRFLRQVGAALILNMSGGILR